MRGMIHHHAQAIEMTDLIEARTKNKDIRLIGARISRSQQDEIDFMKRWLEMRGESPEHPTGRDVNKSEHTAHTHRPADGARGSLDDEHLMPGMLTKAQMAALRKAKGTEFDRLFLSGMIQHHNGALVMVRELFESGSSGQDAELFNFASDVDSGQRAEIRSMQTLLEKNP